MKKELNVDKIIDLYVNQGLTLFEISNIFNFKSGSSISKILKQHNIEIRSGRNAQITNIPSYEELYKLYISEELSIDSIRKFLNVSETTISKLLDEYEIPKRSKTCKFGGWNAGLKSSLETRELQSQIAKEQYKNGREHWNIGNQTPLETRVKISKSLLNGRIPAPSHYGKDWRIQRKSCLQRDNYECQECGDKNKLEVHHWEPFRFSRNNLLDNLVTLCEDCHKEKHRMYIREGFIYEAEKSMTWEHEPYVDLFD